MVVGGADRRHEVGVALTSMSQKPSPIWSSLTLKYTGSRRPATQGTDTLNHCTHSMCCAQSKSQSAVVITVDPVMKK